MVNTMKLSTDLYVFVLCFIHEAVAQTPSLTVVHRGCVPGSEVILGCEIDGYISSSAVYFLHPSGAAVSQDCLTHDPAKYNVTKCDSTNGSFELTIQLPVAGDSGGWGCEHNFKRSNLAEVDTVIPDNISSVTRNETTFSSEAITCARNETEMAWFTFGVILGRNNDSNFGDFTLIRTKSNTPCGPGLSLQYSKLIYPQDVSPCNSTDLKFTVEAYPKDFIQFCGRDSPVPATNGLDSFRLPRLNVGECVGVSIATVLGAVLIVCISMTYCCGLIIFPCCKSKYVRYRLRCCDCTTRCSCADEEAVVCCQSNHTQYAQENKIEPRSKTGDTGEASYNKSNQHLELHD